MKSEFVRKLRSVSLIEVLKSFIKANINKILRNNCDKIEMRASSTKLSKFHLIDFLFYNT